MANRLLTCFFLILGLAWLGVWLEFNRAPHSVMAAIPKKRIATCYGWPNAMYFDAPLTDIFQFETEFRGIAWWEYDRVAWNLLVLVAGWLLIRLSWHGLHSVVQTRYLSLWQCLLGMAVIAGLLALGRKLYESSVQTAAFVQAHLDGALVADSLPEYLVQQLPPEYRLYQVSIVGAELYSLAHFPSGHRLRFVKIMDELDASIRTHLEPDCLRGLRFSNFKDADSFQAILAGQANLRCLSLEQCRVADVPATTLRQLEALNIYGSDRSPFTAGGEMPNVRLMGIDYLDGKEGVTRERPRMPNLTHLRLTRDQAGDWRTQNLLDVLATRQALVEVDLPLSTDNVEQVFEWAEDRPLECVTGLYRRQTDLPSFSTARLRAALTTSQATVWMLQEPALSGRPEPENEELKAALRAWKTDGVPLLHSRPIGPFRQEFLFPVEVRALDVCDVLPSVLVIGEHPALDRLVSQLPPQFPAKRITIAEAEQLLPPPESTSGE